MTTEENKFLERLMIIFEREAEEHLNTMKELLQLLEGGESGQAGTNMIDHLFREAHSLKGAARSVNIPVIESTCQSMEYVLTRLKKNEISLSTRFFTVFYQVIEHLTLEISNLAGKGKASNLVQLQLMLQAL
jgi:two-component system chemotaxis sensor kinase CheA